ncbi:hypothetical protein B0I31_104416 [Saccharothrix carnea]|uniref:Uncharacterized protein n=1 Tax=Saccharothrix carnea TaxID=1280637 RepID=A0A2P8ICD5_SACCR|nr:hypothetical protein [Saccharothrix carnea]PSL56125.1 hypothetical protein B0I31_104416 [Saccharothrix carnea]
MVIFGGHGTVGREAAAMLSPSYDRLPTLPPGVWHVDQVGSPTEAAGHGFRLHLPPTMQHDGTATSSSTA